MNSTFILVLLIFIAILPRGDNIKAVTISDPKTGEAHNFVGNRSTMLKLSGIIRPFIDQITGGDFFQQMLFFGQFLKFVEKNGRKFLQKISQFGQNIGHF